MIEDEELEIIDAFEDEDKTKEFVPVGEEKPKTGRRENHRRTRTNKKEKVEVVEQQQKPATKKANIKKTPKKPKFI